MDKTDAEVLKNVYKYIDKLKNKKAFINYIDKCIEMAQGDIGWEFLGFMEDYMHLVELIPEKFIVVDVGCAYGFQHIMFKNHKGYIGIDAGGINCNPKAFTKNAKFIKGKFRDVVSQGKIIITDQMFGVDNMSLLYSSDNRLDIYLFNKFFKRKFNK